MSSYLFNIPDRFAKATLVEDFHNEELQEAVDDYVERYDSHQKTGQSLVLTGNSGTGKSYTAAAILNDIVTTWGEDYPISGRWFSILYDLQSLMDFRHFHNWDQYSSLIRTVRESSIVVLDDLLHVPDFAQTKHIVMGIIEYRYQYQKPMIITMNAGMATGDFSEVARVFNAPLARKLEDMASDYTFVLG